VVLLRAAQLRAAQLQREELPGAVRQRAVTQQRPMLKAELSRRARGCLYPENSLLEALAPPRPS
jgi:hypothetical protein